MTNGHFWQRKRAESEALQYRNATERYKQMVEHLAWASCLGCREGKVACTHAIKARVFLGCPEEEAKTDKRYRAWCNEQTSALDGLFKDGIFDTLFGGTTKKAEKKSKKETNP